MVPIARREFLKSSLTAAAGATLPAAAWSRVIGSNDDIRVACVGIRGQGRTHIGRFRSLEGVRVVALCDADQAVLEQRGKEFADHGGQVDLVRDFRKLIERKDIDVVSIAAPNHWHALMTVWACQAGKDVYCEKPVSHNVWEGRKSVEAAAKYGRMVQTGTQSRSAAGVRAAIRFVQEGHLGKILVSRGLCYKRRRSIGRTKDIQPIPETVDYDLWIGPARLEALRRRSLHYDWHWVWNTGNGDIGNQGIHQMDIARWALGVNSLSSRVTSFGGRYGYIDDGQTPNTQIAIHEFEPGSSPYAAGGRALLIFEVRGLDTKSYRGVKIGNVIECERGYVALDTGGGKAFDNDGNEIRVFERGTPPGGDHYQNFIAAVRSRNASALRSDILEGHLSSGLCHTGNISHRVGERASIDAATSFAGRIAPPANEGLGRLWKHIAGQYSAYVSGFGGDVVSPDGINPAAALRLVQGPMLEMDASNERFSNSEAANRLLSRDYRVPYVVPAEV